MAGTQRLGFLRHARRYHPQRGDGRRGNERRRSAARASMTLFADERDIPDNGTRANFVFMGYPFDPPLPRDDYGAVVLELQDELPIRFWYFLDEVTTDEMMRKIWRAVLRVYLAVFDTTGGNPNVAFELGLAVA